MSAQSFFQDVADNGKTIPEMIIGNMTPMSDDEYYSRGYQGDNPNAFLNKFSDWLGFTNTQADYDKWKAGYNAWYEQKATNSARAWDEYIQSTYYQRMVEDLKKAGLNPWLALNSGIGNTVNYSSAGSGSSARYKSDEKNKSGASTLIAGFMIAAARVIAALA